MESSQQYYRKKSLGRMCTSRKEIILNRSLADESKKFSEKSTNPLKQDNAIIQVISDDDESEQSSPAECLSERFSDFYGNSSRQADDEIIRRLDRELIANRNLSFGGSSESVENYYHIAPPKKRKVANFFQSNPECSGPTKKDSTFQNSNNIEEAAGFETSTIIEVESVSSHNRNTRLKSNSESSSEFIVSSSSRSTQPLRPRLKNTLPIDSFERCLNNIAKKYPEMTHEERVQLWKYSSDVSDVEDYIDIRQNIEYRKEMCSTSFRQKQPRRIQIENRINNNNNTKEELASSSKRNSDINCNKTLSSSPVKKKSSKVVNDSDVIVVSCNSNASKSTTPEKNDNNLEDDNVLMSINTQTMKIYKNNRALINANIDNNVNVNSSPSLKLLWSDSEDSIFRKNNINLEIDKTTLASGLIQSRAVYKRNIDNSKAFEINDKIPNDGNKQEQFKIPNVPLKYSSLSPTSVITTTTSEAAIKTINGPSQKEEFYKYLGLETKSPNGRKNNDENGIKRRDKISPGRVTRLQREKITKLMKFENKLLNDHSSRKKTNKNVSKSRVNKRNENRNSSPLEQNQRTSESEPKIKIVFSQKLLPSSPPKPRRSCGCIINSGNLTKIKSSQSPSPSNPVKNTINTPQYSVPDKKEKSTTTISKSDTIESLKSNSWIIMRHSYKDKFISDMLTTHHIDSNNVPGSEFVRDLSKTMPEVSSVSKLKNISLLDESKTNPRAAEIYKNFTEMLQNMKQEKYKTSILMRNFDEIRKNNDNGNDEEMKGDLFFQKGEVELNESNKLSTVSLELPCKELPPTASSSPLDDDELSTNSVPTYSVLPNNNELNKVQELNIDIAIEQPNSISAIIPCCFDNAIASSSPDVIDEKFKNNIRRKLGRVKKLNSLKLYRQLLNKKDFIKFLIKNRSKFIRKIIGPPRRLRRLIEPKKNIRKTSGNKSDESVLSPVNVTNMKCGVEECVGTFKSNELTPMEVEKVVKEKTDLVGEKKKKEETNEQINSGELSSSLFQKPLENPLKCENGKIHHIYYEQDLLIVVQELLISFWKYSKVTQMMGKTQEWVSVGEFKRRLYDGEVSAPFKNRLCLSDTNPVYIELRARQFAKDDARECNMASVYVNVYHYNEWKASVLMYSVQLDTIKGLANDINYTSITNSRYFVICWKQEGAMNTSRTGICKYALTPDLDTLASIREFKSMRHVVNHLECVNDEKLIGFGQSQVTIWDHRTGDILTNFDLEMSLGKNLGSVLTSLEFDRYLFLYQIHFEENNDSSRNKNYPSTSSANINNEKKPPELKIIALTLTHTHPKFRLIYSHELPLSFANIKSSIYTGDYLIVTAADTDEEFLLLPNQPEHIHFIQQQQQQQQKDLQQSTSNYIKHFYTTGCHNFIEVTQSTLIVKTIHHYLLNFTK